MRAAVSADHPGTALCRRRRVAHALLAAALLLGAALFLCPPTRFSFYPVCPIHLYLGFLCPGCGATRALAVLLRGRVIEAMRLNALFVLLLPFALAGAIESYRRALRPERFHWPQPPAAVLYATLAAAAIFTVARNLL
jgi:hypothetical protein